MTAAEGGFSRGSCRKHSSGRTAAIEILFASIAVCLLATSSGWADSLSIVTSQPGSSNYLQWSQLGANGTVLAQSFNGTSTGGTTVSVDLSGPNSLLTVVCPASPGTCSWTGPGMPSGNTLLWTSDGKNGGNGPVTLSLNHAQSMVGAMIQADGSSQFTAMVQAFNGSTSLGSVTETSDSKGTAIYLGINDATGSNITAVTFSLVSSNGSTADFAIGHGQPECHRRTGASTRDTCPETATATKTKTATPTPAPIMTPTPAPTTVPSSGSISFVGAGALFDSSGSVSRVSVGLPSGVETGDILLASIVIYDGTAADVPTPPIGWTALRRDTVNSGDKASTWLYYRIAGASEPASYSWSIGANWAAGVMGAWRGVSSTPIDQASGATGAGVSVSIAAPSQVPVANNELQVYFYAAQSASAPAITMSNSLNGRFNTRSSKEGFTLAFADIAAPSAGNASPSYPASTTNAAMTAQALLIIPGSQSGPAPTTPPPAPTPAPTPAPNSSGAMSFVGMGSFSDFSAPVTGVTLSLPAGVRSGDTLVAQIIVYDGAGLGCAGRAQRMEQHSPRLGKQRRQDYLVALLQGRGLERTRLLRMEPRVELGRGRYGRMARRFLITDRHVFGRGYIGRRSGFRGRPLADSE